MEQPRWESAQLHQDTNCASLVLDKQSTPISYMNRHMNVWII